MLFIQGKEIVNCGGKVGTLQRGEQNIERVSIFKFDSIEFTTRYDGSYLTINSSGVLYTIRVDDIGSNRYDKSESALKLFEILTKSIERDTKINEILD